MKQLFLVLWGKNDIWNLSGIYSDREKAIKRARSYGEDNADHFEVKVYSGNFGIVEIGKEDKA